MLAKGAYNTVNGVVNSEYSYAAAKAYLLAAPLFPAMWPGVLYVAIYAGYSEAMIPGGSWKDWR